MRYLIVIIMALMLPLPVAARDNFKGLEAAKRGECQRAPQEDAKASTWNRTTAKRDAKTRVAKTEEAKARDAKRRQAAERGDATAQFGLGMGYQFGFGVPKDETKALKWHKRAAEQGHARAHTSLGDMYRLGSGVPVDKAEAAKWYRKAVERGDARAKTRLDAEQGNPDAQYILGDMHHRGRDVLHDYDEALKWYRKAAEQDNRRAQHALGDMYHNGWGVPRDDTEAAKWYLKAAEQKHSMARYTLGDMYHEGCGVPQDDAEALKWHKRAAETGHGAWLALNALGDMYRNGWGVLQDDAEAVKFYSKAAEAGSPRAQAKLAVMFQNGNGVRQNYVLAYALFELSRRKIDDAERNRDALAKKMTPAQIERATQLIRDVRREKIKDILGHALFAASREPCGKAISRAEIVGKWQSSPSLGQLGLIQTNMQFNEDRTFTTKLDFISFPNFQPDLEYFWFVSKGTYSIDGNEVTVNFGRTRGVQKKRGEDETIGPKKGKRRTQVFHLEEGKLVTKDLVLTRL